MRTAERASRSRSRRRSDPSQGSWWHQDTAAARARARACWVGDVTLRHRPARATPPSHRCPHWTLQRLKASWLWRLLQQLAVAATVGASLLSAGERAALVDLYGSTSGASWTGTVTGWANYTNSSVDPCSPVPWTGLTCSCTSTNCSVVGLSLVSKHLSGSLPASISNLTALQYVGVANVPTALGRELLRGFGGCLETGACSLCGVCMCVCKRVCRPSSSRS